VAKVIVTGATRAEALQRSRRALAEMEVAGMATALLRRGIYGYRHAASPDAGRADIVADDLHAVAEWALARV
jgi:acetyl/propionyl-CoA carboxylase alpha subunit